MRRAYYLNLNTNKTSWAAPPGVGLYISIPIYLSILHSHLSTYIYLSIYTGEGLLPSIDR